MLTIDHVTKRYGGKSAVRDVSMRVEKGSLVALLGPNGSGKTTLMKMIAGLTLPSSGKILFHGKPIGLESKRHIAYMPTEGYFFSYMSALDAGRYYRDFFEDFDMNSYLRMLQAEKLNPRDKIRAMSSGMVAKVKLALTFARNSALTMLDEPLNGIDLIARERTLALICENRSPERAIVISSHLVDQFEDQIDQAVFMLEGGVALMGAVEEIRSRYGASIVEIYKKVYAGSEV